MKVHALSPVGATMTGLGIGRLTDEVADRVRSLLDEHGVLVFSDRHVDDSDFVAFLRSLGQLTFTAGETPVAGHPDVNFVTNVGRLEPSRSVFHTDTSYVEVPPAYTALRAVTVPRTGGATLFTNQYTALESLPESVRDDLQGRSITHVMSRLEGGDGPAPRAEHPVIRPHPLSGRDALYLSTPQRCVALSGADVRTATDTVAFLYAHCTAQSNISRHTWSAGDVVVWDNQCVMHKADHEGVIGDQTMHRGMALAATAA